MIRSFYSVLDSHFVTIPTGNILLVPDNIKISENFK